MLEEPDLREFFLHKIDILIEDITSRPNIGLVGKNYLKNCKLTKLQRHKCARAALQSRLRHRRLSGAFPPFSAPLTARRRLDLAPSGPLKPSRTSAKARSFIPSAKGEFLLGSAGAFLMFLVGQQWGRESAVCPSQIHTGAAARKATGNVMPVWCSGTYQKCRFGLAVSKSETDTTIQCHIAHATTFRP